MCVCARAMCRLNKVTGNVLPLCSLVYSSALFIILMGWGRGLRVGVNFGLPWQRHGGSRREEEALNDNNLSTEPALSTEANMLTSANRGRRRSS